MRIRLKPCPFCGDENIVKYFEAKPYHRVGHVIGCNTPSCPCYHKESRAYEYESEMIEMWNTRIKWQVRD